MEKILKLYTYVDGGINDTPFPNSDNPIEIGAFRYDAKRMGGAPTITASVDYPSCLDGVWTDKVYAKFNGEKYYLKQIPTSSYDNADVMYKHEVTLVSERAILDNVYFFDVVTGDPIESDKPVSNSTKVTFFGSVRDFASRLNASLEYSGLDYEVVVDDEITTEEKLMSFEDQFFSNVLQAIYNTYEVPYYFDGKTIHIGYAKSDVIVPDLSYGVDNALLSITKNNANYKTVNRATGYGSSENLTFYYPNEAPKGKIELSTYGELNKDDIVIKDITQFNRLSVDTRYTFHGDPSLNETSAEVIIPSLETKENFVDNSATLEKVYIENNEVEIQVKIDLSLDNYSENKIELDWVLQNYANPIINMTPPLVNAQGKNHIDFEVKKVVLENDGIQEELEFDVKGEKTSYYSKIISRENQTDEGIVANKLRQTGIALTTPNIRGNFTLIIVAQLKTLGNFWSVVPDYYWGSDSKKKPYTDIVFTSNINTSITGGWKDSEGTSFNMNNYGIRFKKAPVFGDAFSFTVVEYINTSKTLQPTIYRDTKAKERFYNAVNYPFLAENGYELKYGEYLKKEDVEGNTTEIDYVHNDAYKDDEGNYIRFDHPYVEGKAKEHIVAVEDLMPTIKEAVNSMGLRMDMFSEFAYDNDDSDETEENEDGSDTNFVHSYFFAKLRKLDFNLFECAIEQQPMTISFTSGACGACNFEIGVTEEFPQKNPVRVNPDGTLMRDANGRVVCGQFEPIYENEIQDRQQDTINNEVWIALRKEEDTYGELMPKAPVDGVGGHRPKAARNEDGTPNNEGDTFVILGINLPEEYVTRQERQLEKEIIKYIKDNNEEKFTFSIGFSRIYFAENENILKNLSENSKVRIFYNNLPYDLYVSSFSYNLNAGDVLPDIKIELDETLKISQNPIQKAISQVKSQLGNALRNIDVVGAGTPYFLRKDVDDEVIGRVNFRKGVKFGEGGKVEILDNNSAKLTIDYIEVTKKATFTSLEIQEKTHVGGQLLVTSAAINCGEVEEFDEYYRCYFQTRGEEGEETYNLFMEGDQAICQTYNTWGSKYYWRLVVGAGDDYIDLSKREGEYDEDSDVPSVGDKIIQLGHRTLKDRQNAIVIAAHGDNSPYIIQYKGINDFDLGEDKIVTKLSSTENIFTGKVHMEMGSDGLENIDGGLNIGGQNMLRNSGFTGDYLSAQIADEIVLNAIDELFNPPFAHWTENNAVVYDSEVAASGKEVQISDGGDVLQTLYQKVLENESYVVSFKAKGTSLTIKVGEVSETISLTNEWQKYSISIVASNTSEDFGIVNATCSICDLQLERGTIATSWGRSFLDNSSDRAYYQARKYLDDAIKGFTDVSGGLILTGHIKVGEQSEGVMTEETGGINGIYNDDNDVAFWAGGSDAQAITSVSKYKNQPTYQPTEEELATMAKFVVTHGGRAILEDAIVRGTIYAKDGIFTGTVNATSGEFNNVDVQTGKIANFNISGSHLGIQEELGGDGMFLYNQYIGFRKSENGYKRESIIGENVLPSFSGITGLAKYENTTTDTFEAMAGIGYGVISNVSGYKNSYAFASEKGVFAGFRPHVAILGSDNSPLQLGKYHHTVLALYGGTIVLDGTPENGQEYEIICPNTSVEEGRVQIITYDGTGNIYLMYDGVKRSGFSVHDLGGTRQVVKLVYFAQDNTWFAWHHSY